MSRKRFKVIACYDDEAGVWFIQETDVPGLTAEAKTVEEMMQKLDVRIPEMLELNHHLLNKEIIDKAPYELVTHQVAEARVH